MEKYDIIQVFRDNKSTSDKYVVLEIHSNNTPKSLVPEYVFLQDSEEDIKFRTMFMASDEHYPWKVVGKADASWITNPHHKVIRKIKLMTAKRKEQGYAF
jgi:hypothetical protein